MKNFKASKVICLAIAAIMALSVPMMSSAKMIKKNTTATTSTSVKSKTTTNKQAKAIVKTAIAQKGIAFKMGGCSPKDGFDNSGLLYYVSKKNGFKISRQAKDQPNSGTRVSYAKLKAGDFVYFTDTKSKTAQYGGVVINKKTMIIATVPGTKVVAKRFDSSYWKNHFVAGIRLAK